MAFCTQCGQQLKPGQKFCTKCGKKVPEAMTSPAAPQAAMQAPPPIVPQMAQAASAATSNSLANVLNIKASNQTGEWVVSSWDMPALAQSAPTPLLTRIKQFFIPANKLAYLWGLLPVLTTAVTIISYIFHLIGRLFS